jgi:hypothetical protein
MVVWQDLAALMSFLEICNHSFINSPSLQYIKSTTKKGLNVKGFNAASSLGSHQPISLR